MLKLKVFNYQTGEFQERTLTPELDHQTEWIIGRASNCDIVLPHPIVSRVHGRISYRDGQYYFTDFGSTDGSRINNGLVSINQNYALKEDDVIRIGEFVLAIDAIESASVQKAQKTSDQAAWQGDLMVRCVRVVKETEDVKTFSFVAEPAVAFHFLPGQFVTLELNINGETVQRCYSISSSPTRSHTLEITVKRVAAPADQPHLPAGLVSNWLHDHVTVGSQLKLKGAALGQFTCAPQPPRKVLMISAGSGITPMISMLRWLYDTASNCDVIFLHSARTPHDIVLRHELEWMTARQSNFRLAITVTQPELGQPWYGFTGRLNEAMLNTIAPDFRERSVYVCGSNGFMDATKTLLSQLSFPMEHYHAESFGGAKPRQAKAKATATPAAVPVATPVAARETSLSPDSFSPDSDIEPIVVFANSAKEAPQEAGLSILELAEQEGVKIRSSCRQGVCGACRVRKQAGDVQYEADPAGLDADDRAAGYILPCVAAAVGRVVVEA